MDCDRKECDVTSIDKKIIGVGSPVVDQIVNVPDTFIERIGGEKGGMELITSEQMEELLRIMPPPAVRQTGGSAGNTIFAMAKLGMPCRFLGMIGGDQTGRFYRESFEALGGDDSAICTHSDMLTGQCLSFVTPDGERTMRTNLGAAMCLEPRHIQASHFAGCVHAHIEGYLLFNPELLLAVLKAAKSEGCRVSLDLASFEVVKAARETLPDLLEKYVDMVFANEEEAIAFSESDDIDTCMSALKQHCATVAIKRGENGALICTGDKLYNVPAHTAKRVVDTTGAGDFWAAGFLYGDLNQRGVETAGAYGARLGAEVVQEMGAWITDETWQSVIDTISAR